MVRLTKHILMCSLMLPLVACIQARIPNRITTSGDITVHHEITVSAELQLTFAEECKRIAPPESVEQCTKDLTAEFLNWVKHL